MENWGGARQGAGRKSKDEEKRLIEKLSPLEETAHNKLKEAINAGKDWAIKMYFEYMYGKPKQIIDQKTEVTMNNFNLKEAVNFDNSKP
mgnify:CR=1 FL=1